MNSTSPNAKFSGKIFGIGFHKTGTSSLARALDLLGYNVTSSFGLMDTDIDQTVLTQAIKIVPQFDAFQDNPWPIIYRDLDKQFPNSKFILTVRPTEQWLKSVIRHFAGRTTPMRSWIYGVGDPRGNEAIYKARYERHNEEVKAYFVTRPGNLLLLNLTTDNNWTDLCSFLNAPIPSEPFPHTNSHNERNKLINKLRRGLSRLTH